MWKRRSIGTACSALTTFALGCGPIGSSSVPTEPAAITSTSVRQVAAASPSEPAPLPGTPPVCPTHVATEAERRDLAASAEEVMRAIEEGNDRNLASLVHPDKGLALGLLGTVNYRLAQTEVRKAPTDSVVRNWDGRSNEADEPLRWSYQSYFTELRKGHYRNSDVVGYDEVVLEDSMCTGRCVAEELTAAFGCVPFVQLGFPTESAHNPGMWRFLVLAFEADDQGTASTAGERRKPSAVAHAPYRLIGLLEDEWSP